ncbi:hypothetical protein HI113_26845 [Corallococcus exiguus]|uniref:hypothetical protein n=1 Tax=Corallococcus TaxID=83461 RepID=UPI0011C422B4|nr:MULTISPECIES: hypothetical protein [Corallococcus]NNB97524.1 hypothetical protein [Corallococcus exiguus]NPC48791.1 hypothetical protein [Corallococcus exiguus]
MASLLFASPAWARGNGDGPGPVFFLGAVVVVLGFIVGFVLLFLNVTGRQRRYSPILGLLAGLGTVVLGMGLSEPLLSGENDGVMEVALWCLVLSGVCEIIAAGWALLRRDRGSAPKNP